MKNKIILLLLVVAMSSCSVQQFAVNTSVKPFENGGKVFGERTKGKEVKKTGSLFVFGINCIPDKNTEVLAKELNASSYTIETKRNVLSAAVFYLTAGIVDYKVTKVIKR